MIYEIDDGRIINREYRENIFTNHRLKPQGHQHHGESAGHGHENLAEGLKDCKYLISKGGGWRLVEDLKKFNINPVFTGEELIESAVNKFVKGELVNDTDLICGHNKHENT
jgi:hypothetical protein